MDPGGKILIVKSEDFKELELHQSFYSNGMMEYEAEIRNGIPDGKVKYWNIEGKLVTYANYENGKLHGTSTRFHENGELASMIEYFYGEINGEYEKETGKVIIEKINELNIDPLDCPGILVAKHGPFTWGATVEDAVKHAELLEYIARLAWLAISINLDAKPISNALLNKHFSRKHGPDAYYGQDPD